MYRSQQVQSGPLGGVIGHHNLGGKLELTKALADTPRRRPSSNVGVLVSMDRRR